MSDGERGPKGDHGQHGERGVKGQIGETGDAGLQGELGEQGDTGIRGAKGELGEQGDAGVSGERGPKGDHGQHGDPGDTGVTGERGTHGERGDTGLQGAAGERGPRGDLGPSGVQGVRGSQGAPGKSSILTRNVTAAFVILALVSVGTLGFITHQVRETRKLSKALCASINDNRKVLRDEHARKLVQTERYLKEHPNGFGGISRQIILDSLDNERAILRVVQPVRCGKIPS